MSITMRPKVRLLIWSAVALLMASPVLFIVLSQLPFFYYYKYNRVRAHLEAIPGLIITDTRKHEDFTLEDCWYAFRFGESEEVELALSETEDWEAPFNDEFDGVVFLRPYGSLPNGYERRVISKARLLEWGVDFHRLADLVPHLKIIMPKLREVGVVSDEGVSHALHLMWDLDSVQPRPWIRGASKIRDSACLPDRPE
jgi:hypothetical protein